MVELSKELKEFCKNQYSKGCAKCFLHDKCAVSYPVTRYHIDKHTTELNKAITNNEHKTTKKRTWIKG